jgi:monoamine oxidase
MTGRTVVVGGGAAGIAAARRLHDAGADVLLVEASDRLGGRARSVRLEGQGSAPSGVAVSGWYAADRGWTATSKGVIDLGCGWLHSAGRNPWTIIARREGVAIDRSSPNWGVQWRDLGFPPEQKRAFGEAYERFEAAAHAALDGPDQPLSAFIAADDPWRAMIDAISGYANGAPLDQVSLHDWAAYEDAATDDNWALPAGYGTLIVDHAGDVPVRLGIPVTRVDHSCRTIRLDTPAGTIEAARVLLAIPTTAYAAIRFDPPLAGKTDAAAALPLGLADKVFLAVDRPEWPPHAHLIGNPHATCTASHRLSPFGLPIVESFFGGTCAESMADGRAAIDFAREELVGLLGASWRERLTPIGATHWRAVPHIHGSYSHARVGHASARRILAEPVEDRLFFAGEACSPHDFSTAHGAYQTGMDAADAILRLLDTAPRR